MKKLLLLIISVCYFNFQLFASGEPLSVGGRNAAMGNASVTLSDAFSVFNNQAGMAFLQGFSAGLFTQRNFGISELSFSAGGVTLPTKSGVFGLSAGYFGFSGYNEKKAGLAYSRLFGSKISGGIQIDYLGTSISEYGNASAFTFEAGLIVKVSDHFTTGAHVFNPVRINSGFANEKIPTTFNLGVSYAPNSKVLIASEIAKDIDFPVHFRAGIEYQVIEVLYLRAGIETKPSQYTFGFGINLDQLKIDFASSYHPVLGVTPQISLSYTFGKH
ncbi:MAG: hypothetical protein H0W62_05555 [Chitinophagales bacterium]|nr:hypothetical protein [Chitinophagales bacterium]